MSTICAGRVCGTYLAPLYESHRELPPDALLTPVGTGSPMSIFGLPKQDVTWGISRSCPRTPSSAPHGWMQSLVSSPLLCKGSWRSTTVRSSSRTTKGIPSVSFRRLVLATSAAFEFTLYFVEYLRPRDFGDRSTTLVLKALELCCRFRFLFLEKNSEF